MSQPCTLQYIDVTEQLVEYPGIEDVHQQFRKTHHWLVAMMITWTSAAQGKFGLSLTNPIENAELQSYRGELMKS